MGIMSNPLRHKETGHCFERESIMNWIYQGNLICPLTRQPLHTDDLALDTALQAKILKWKISQETNDSTCLDDDDDTDFDATFEDILEITNRIKTISCDTSRRRQSAPMPRTITTAAKEEEEAQPPKRQSEGNRRLSNLRLKVLRDRDDRIKSMLSASKGSEKVDSSNTETTTSLTQMMTARV